MHDEELPALPTTVLARIFSDELNWLLEQVGRLGSEELQEAARARMFSLPERIRQEHSQEEPDAARH